MNHLEVLTQLAILNAGHPRKAAGPLRRPGLLFSSCLQFS